MVEPITEITERPGAVRESGAGHEPRPVTWPCPTGPLRLEEHQTHLWAFPLDLDGADIARLSELLSPEEQQRARRFRLDLNRDRFIAGRGQLRLLLSYYIKLAPAKLQFCYGSHGKPELTESMMCPRLQFNLAHSAELALLAVNRRFAAGVDLEELHPLEDAPALVARFFSPRENLAFQQLRESQKLTAFFNLWTRKEAWLKATGQGIGYSLNKVEVSFLPDEEPRLLATPEARPVPDWQLTNLKPATGFIAALAVADVKNSSQTFQFHPALENRTSFYLE
jgi:4'-phosphopantetheinyl transferase